MNQFKDYCKNGDEKGVQSMLDSGYDVQARESQGQTGFHWACGYGHAHIVSLLLESGRVPRCEVDAGNDYGDTGLLLSCYHDNTSVVALLIEAGCDLDSENRFGDNALSWAANRGNRKVISMLIEAGCNFADEESNVNVQECLA